MQSIIALFTLSLFSTLFFTVSAIPTRHLRQRSAAPGATRAKEWNWRHHLGGISNLHQNHGRQDTPDDLFSFLTVTTTVAVTLTSDFPSPTSSSPTATPSPSTTSLDDQIQYLELHNNIRAVKGAGPLSWNTTLEAYAQSWADSCQFKHSGGPFGENLAAGTGEFTPGEASQYDPENPSASHYTQVVWKGTAQVGCAVATCTDLLGSGTGDASYHVCEYYDHGNTIGEFLANVEP
ncbi:PR-1-like protein [Sistotremastrum niveocremeum HHB9708]|uniref:PR-1-like protein n=1 Tax=Sistotremastrum niveocremeum HHB9708 TaxID=1314777 RepID=A0A164VFS8_9AGAM|nr:PR-1-like protein [Sistotremastrum niveocremeum HHB9708]